MGIREDYRGAAAALTLSADLTAGDLTFSVSGDTSGWPTGGAGRPFTITIDRGKASEEKVLCSTLTPTAVAVSLRGYDGTSDANHTAGASVEHTGPSATKMDDVDGHVYDTTRDDHPQYILTSGERGFSGVDQIVDLPVSIGGTANQPGSANTLARSDHVHAIASQGISDSDMFTPQVVPPAALQDSSISRQKLVAGSVDDTLLAAAAVITAKIADSAVTPAKTAKIPAVRLYDSTPNAIPHNTPTILSGFDTEDYDTDTMHSPSVNPGRITFKTAGFYLVAANVRLVGVAGGIGQLAFANLRQNGTLVIARDETPFAPDSAGSVSVVTLNPSTPQFFDVNDYLEVQVHQQSGASITPPAGADFSPVFTAVWLGNAV